MEPLAPSQTAYAVARMRAGHQILDAGNIFSDPYACAILGEQPAEIVAALNLDPNSAAVRTYMARRSRIGEDWLHEAYLRGVRQAVILGAGFDTFSLRNPYSDLAVFEVDHPATQRWKQGRLAAAALSIPSSLKFVPVDFSKDDLTSAMQESGFDKNATAFFLWLGVVPYLHHEAISKTLNSIAAIPGAEVVFDYSEPLENYAPEQRPYIEKMAQRVAALGEPWLSYFDPVVLAQELKNLGYQEIQDLDRAGIVNWGSDERAVSKVVGPHLIRARRIPESL
ncbi:MAG TPA: SAM-dependent methyltransferase [Paralcaligenes sp.]